MAKPYSHSAMETFKTCPLKFKYNYILKPDIERKQSIEAFMGSMVHETLEQLYKDLKFNKINSLEEVLSFYNDVWTKNYSPASTDIIRKEYTEDNYKQMGFTYLTGYYNKYQPFNQGKTIGLEMKINLRFYDVDREKIYDLTGVIDRLTLISDTHIEIHDYKTNMTPKTQEEVDEDRQLALYAIAIKEMFPFVQTIDLIWHFLSVGIELKSTRTDLDLDNLRKEAISTIRAIEDAKAKDAFSPKASALCEWCEFRSLCPVMAHEIRLREVPANEFLKDDGVSLVNKYSELKRKKDELTVDLDIQMEKLKEALINYAQENKIERVVGSNTYALVKCYENTKLPEKGTKERNELDDFIKQSGLWDDLSELSSTEINNFEKNGLFSDNLVNLLHRFIEKTKTYRVYVNNRRK